MADAGGADGPHGRVGVMSRQHQRFAPPGVQALLDEMEGE